MRTIQVGRPIEIDMKTASLLELISEGRWEDIDPEILRSIVPDANLFVKFLERHKLTDTREARIVLSRLGTEGTQSRVATVAGASNTTRAQGELRKILDAWRTKVAATKMSSSKQPKTTKSSLKSRSRKRRPRRNRRPPSQPLLPA
jgi:hypothetical protein